MTEKPHLLAIVLCERVTFDMLARRYALFGVSPAIGFPRFPAVLPPFFGYAAVSDIRMQSQATMRILDGEGNVLFAPPVNVTLTDTDPLAEGEIVIPFMNVRIEKPGDYFVQLVIDGEPIGDRRLRVRQMATP